MTFKQGSILGILAGIVLWLIFQAIELLSKTESWLSLYPFKTFVIVVVSMAILGGIILWEK